MAIKHITDVEEFKTQVEESDKLSVIDFWAPWCGPCKMLGPIFEKVSEEYTDVQFVKIDIDEAQDLAEQFSIVSIPTLIIMKDGEVVDQQMGALSKDQLKQFIDQNK